MSGSGSRKRKGKTERRKNEQKWHEINNVLLPYDPTEFERKKKEGSR